jgi:hypothetical protein
VATTQLFVELLVIGVGAAVWLAFLLAVILRLPGGIPFPDLNAAHLVGLSSIAYVLGIVVDRLAWSAFRFAENRRRDRVFEPGQDPSVEDRERFVLENSSILRQHIVYNRSPLRICRSWILNFMLTGVCAGAWAVQQRAGTIAAIALSALAFSGLTAYTATLLARDYYLNVRHSYDFVARAKTMIPPPGKAP